MTDEDDPIMLKFLTHKLRSQSLNEVVPTTAPAEPDPDSLDDSEINFKEEGRDSGTESDDENLELEELELSRQQMADRNQHDTSSYGSISPPLFNERYSDSRGCSPCYDLSCMASIAMCTSAPNATCTSARRVTHILDGDLDENSCTSDLDRSGLNIDFERHSSEEELNTIIRDNFNNNNNNNNNDNFNPSSKIGHEVAPMQNSRERRKCSRINVNLLTKTCNQASQCDISCSCTDQAVTAAAITGAGGGSSDEEVRELLRPQPIMFRATPPKDLTRSKAKVSSSLPLSKISVPNVTPVSRVSPRKRHRQTSSTSETENSSTERRSSLQRPCLDFEKMQKTLVKKHCSHSIGRTKIVKIKTVSGSGRPGSRLLYDPSVFAFRSISMTYSPLTPVEEPSCAY